MAVVCSECGVGSELDDQFVHARRSFRRRRRSICPRCAEERRLRAGHRGDRWMLLCLVGSVLLAYWWPDWPLGWILLGLSLVWPACVPTVILHEAGHSFAARMLGFRLLWIVLGSGKLRWQSEWLGVRVERRSIPCGGITLVGPLEAEGERDQAKAALEEARSLDPACLLLERAAAALG